MKRRAFLKCIGMTGVVALFPMSVNAGRLLPGTIIEHHPENDNTGCDHRYIRVEAQWNEDKQEHDFSVRCLNCRKPVPGTTVQKSPGGSGYLVSMNRLSFGYGVDIIPGKPATMEFLMVDAKGHAK